MEIVADALPEDLEALRAMVLGLQQKLAQSDQITADLVSATLWPQTTPAWQSSTPALSTIWRACAG